MARNLDHGATPSFATPHIAMKPEQRNWVRKRGPDGHGGKVIDRVSDPRTLLREIAPGGQLLPAHGAAVHEHTTALRGVPGRARDADERRVDQPRAHRELDRGNAPDQEG